MSLLRDRAMAVSFASTLSAFRPAAARDWFVRATSCFSDEELNVFELQAFVGPAATSRPTEVTTNANSVASVTRRGSPAIRLARGGALS